MFRFTVFSFWLELCNKIQISKRKGNKDTNRYISCILLRNAGINNSKRWLEFGLTDHLNQEQYIIRGATTERKRVVGFQVYQILG